MSDFESDWEDSRACSYGDGVSYSGRSQGQGEGSHYCSYGSSGSDVGREGEGERCHSHPQCYFPMEMVTPAALATGLGGDAANYAGKSSSRN